MLPTQRYTRHIHLSSLVRAPLVSGKLCKFRKALAPPVPVQAAGDAIDSPVHTCPSSGGRSWVSSCVLPPGRPFQWRWRRSETDRWLERHGNLIVHSTFFYLLPLTMAVLSLTLKDRPNRCVNLVAGICPMFISYVINFLECGLGLAAHNGPPTGIEQALTLGLRVMVTAFIPWFAWRRPKQEVQATGQRSARSGCLSSHAYGCLIPFALSARWKTPPDKRRHDNVGLRLRLLLKWKALRTDRDYAAA